MGVKIDQDSEVGEYDSAMQTLWGTAAGAFESRQAGERIGCLSRLNALIRAL
jgi:hypothetical protein